ncbi:MAG: cellulase family glycosylhydrolase [Prevotella sp.]|nr:cellulase family glycosylhydrolase [Prevotella sp.]MCI1848022.1 cellulase family glycosylhydrolase [Prevotella sp.]
MKYSFMILAVIMLILFPACSSDKGSDDHNGVNYIINKNALTFTDNGGTDQFSVQAGGKPLVTSSASWCTVTLVTQGMHVYNYTVTTQAYKASSESDYDDRKAVITVTQGSHGSTILVTQTPTYGLFVDDPSSGIVEASSESQDITIKLRANGAYQITTDDWMSVVRTRASLEKDTVVIKVDRNVSDARSGKVSFTLGGVTESVTVNQQKGFPSDDMNKTAMEVAGQMYPGWNLGNTLEAGNSINNFTDKGGVSTEVSWQGTKTTQAIIDFVKSEGFRSVRIPVAWVMGHLLNSETMTIDPEWMKRVKEIVDYCIADDLYVIINDHWDGGWIEEQGFSASSSSYVPIEEAIIKEKGDRLKKLWANIAMAFKDYGEHLIFAGLNEPLQNYTLFNGRHEVLTPILERYNQAFIDGVRSTGGNNEKRILVVQGPGTSISSTYSYFELPSDIQKGRLMVEVHYYEPWNFCGGNMTKVWNDETYLQTQFQKMKIKFTDVGIPVIIGEYGAQWQENSDSHNAAIEAWYKAVNRNAVNDGIVPFAWDVNACTWPSYSILNRSTLTVWNTPAMQGVKEGVAASSWPY